MHSHRIKQQRGVVLIMVLLIVAVITGLAVKFAGDFQLTMARAEQRFHGGQARQYLLSAESFAQWGLVEDGKEDEKNGNNNFDHLGEAWFKTKISAPVEGGWTEAKLSDAQARFNLNQLDGRPQKYTPGGDFTERFTAEQIRFIRLLQTNDDEPLEASDAEEIVEAIIDWLDVDDNVTGSGGAETDFYSGLDVPYRAANQAFVSISELRLIKGVTPKLYQYLEPFLVVLPDDSGINVNTASKTVLRTINREGVRTPLSQADADTMASTRGDKEEGEEQTLSSTEAVVNAAKENIGYKTIEEFFNENSAVFGTEPLTQESTRGLTTGSEYFLLTSEVQMVKQYRRGVSLLKREQVQGDFVVSVIRRNNN